MTPVLPSCPALLVVCLGPALPQLIQFVDQVKRRLQTISSEALELQVRNVAHDLPPPPTRVLLRGGGASPSCSG